MKSKRFGWVFLALVIVALIYIVLMGNFDGYSGDLKYRFTPYSMSDGKAVRKLELSRADSETLYKTFEPLFGTPNQPRIETGDSELIKKLQLGPEQLKLGSLLYRKNCLHCHGVEGSGEGVTAQFIEPRPRDFRLGKFKFVSTVRINSDGTANPAIATLPSRVDLLRTIQVGILGAGMPSSRQFTDIQRQGVVSYVMFLAVRGMTEFQLAMEMQEDKSKPTQEAVGKIIQRILIQWASDEENKYPVSLKAWNEMKAEQTIHQWKRGESLFLGAGACHNCHGKDGKADPTEIATEGKQFDEWGHPMMPRNLRSSILRGGEEPINLFHRIRLGIKPSRMPAADPKQLTDEDVWQLVGYVMYRLR